MALNKTPHSIESYERVENKTYLYFGSIDLVNVIYACFRNLAAVQHFDFFGNAFDGWTSPIRLSHAPIAFDVVSFVPLNQYLPLRRLLPRLTSTLVLILTVPLAVGSC